jgi:hypothetical protein
MFGSGSGMRKWSDLDISIVINLSSEYRSGFSSFGSATGPLDYENMLLTTTVFLSSLFHSKAE